MNWLRPLGFVGLIVALIIVAMLTLRGSGPKPKGASAAVDAAAKQFVESRGAVELGKVSKLHFRTALRAQGLQEPPKTEWRKR